MKNFEKYSDSESGQRDKTRERGGWKEKRKAARTAKSLKGDQWATKGKARHANKYAK